MHTWVHTVVIKSKKVNHIGKWSALPLTLNQWWHRSLTRHLPAPTEEFNCRNRTWTRLCLQMPRVQRYQAISSRGHDYKYTVFTNHYGDIIMGATASPITSLTIVCPNVYSGADQRIHQSYVSLSFVRGIHRSPVNTPHKGPVTRKMFPFGDVIMRSIVINETE